MFDFFPVELKSGFPTFLTALYTLSWGLVLSSMVAITHKKTFTGFEYPDRFFQAMILSTIVATAVMMSIGDSLARGLGIFGALAIIRFRTRIDEPKNLLFLFATLALGIALGVYGFSIAFSSTIMFCATAWLLYWLVELRNLKEKLVLTVYMESAQDTQLVEDFLKSYSLKHHLVAQEKRKDGNWQMEWEVLVEAGHSKAGILENLSGRESISQVKWSKTGNLVRV